MQTHTNSHIFGLHDKLGHPEKLSLSELQHTLSTFNITIGSI